MIYCNGKCIALTSRMIENKFNKQLKQTNVQKFEKKQTNETNINVYKI